MESSEDYSGAIFSLYLFSSVDHFENTSTNQEVGLIFVVQQRLRDFHTVLRKCSIAIGSIKSVCFPSGFRRLALARKMWLKARNSLISVITSWILPRQIRKCFAMDARGATHIIHSVGYCVQM